jgi:hypothetical protein
MSKCNVAIDLSRHNATVDLDLAKCADAPPLDTEHLGVDLALVGLSQW